MAFDGFLAEKLKRKEHFRPNPALEEYIKKHYEEPSRIENESLMFDALQGDFAMFDIGETPVALEAKIKPEPRLKRAAKQAVPHILGYAEADRMADLCLSDASEGYESRLNERLSHLDDTFSEYLIYMIDQKGLKHATVYRDALVDKKVFSKIKNNPNYHPNKLTAMCLCMGAKLNLDESKDLLAKAGYAFSGADKTDIIFEYFLENQIYDMYELDIQLEEHGLPCIIE